MSQDREQFEYCSEIVTHEQVILRANQLGLSGWEMVGVYPVALRVRGPFSEVEDTRFECIFKRKVLKVAPPTQYLPMQAAQEIKHPAGCPCGFCGLS